MLKKYWRKSCPLSIWPKDFSDSLRRFLQITQEFYQILWKISTTPSLPFNSGDTESPKHSNHSWVPQAYADVDGLKCPRPKQTTEGHIENLFLLMEAHRFCSITFARLSPTKINLYLHVVPFVQWPYDLFPPCLFRQWPWSTHGPAIALECPLPSVRHLQVSTNQTIGLVVKRKKEKQKVLNCMHVYIIYIQYIQILKKGKRMHECQFMLPNLLFHYFCCTHPGKTHLTSVKLICTVQPRWPFGKLGRWRCSKPWMKGPGTEMKDRGIRILTQESVDFLTKTTLWHDPWWKTVVFMYIL